MFVDLVVTQQGLRLEVKVGKRKRPKRDVEGVCWCGAKVAPGFSCFELRGPAELRRVMERELVSISTLCAPHTLIGRLESVLCSAASC